MPRCRMLHPDFFQSEQLLACQPLARLLFAGLWCWADREGRIEDRPVRLKIQILPGDSCDVNDLLGELAGQVDDEGTPLVLRYQVGRKRLLCLPGFVKRQNPHYREAASKLPGPDDSAKAPGFTPNQGGGSPPDDRGVSLPDEGGGSRAESESESESDTESESVEEERGHLRPSEKAQEVLSAWQSVALARGYRGARKLAMTPDRKAKIATRLRDPFWRENWREALEHLRANGSPFLEGKDQPDRSSPWVADIAWFLKPDTVAKILEGNHDAGKPQSKLRDSMRKAAVILKELEDEDNEQQQSRV